ncbi:MAG: hypothetical protein NTX28_08100 [Novosphingobium sp.]|nr:hypothetical protein [Novosphingobium sp.]
MAKRTVAQHQRRRAPFAAQGEVIERKHGRIGAFGHTVLDKEISVVLKVYHASLKEAQADAQVAGVEGGSPFTRLDWLALLAQMCLDPAKARVSVAADGARVAAQLHHYVAVVGLHPDLGACERQRGDQHGQ